MSRLPIQLSARLSLFLYVRSHVQWQYYLNLGETRTAANEADLRGPKDGPQVARIIKIRPIA
jgi:hypothetical protein